MVFHSAREVNVKNGFCSWTRLMVAIVIASGLSMAVVADVSAQSRFEGDAKVLRVDEENNMLFLAHGPIEGLMPPMRHGFVVHKPELLKDVKKGDTIHFILEIQNEAIGVTGISQIKDEQQPD